MVNQNRQKGFTLIEILIVVAIIGMLASIVLVGLGSFRSRGRDARRIADIRQTQNALELYYTANNSYPKGIKSWADLTDAITKAGIGVSTVSNDPLFPSRTYDYASNDGQSYVIRASLEDNSNPALNDDVDGPAVQGLNCDDASPENYYCVQF